VCVIKFQAIVWKVHQAKMVRQRGAHVYSVELHHFGHGETEHTAGQQREDVFGHGQLRFHRGVCARDVCQSKIAFYSDYNLFADLIRLRLLFINIITVCFFSVSPPRVRTGRSRGHVLRHGTVFQVGLEHHGRFARGRVHHRSTHVTDLRKQSENIWNTKGEYILYYIRFTAATMWPLFTYYYISYHTTIESIMSNVYRLRDGSVQIYHPRPRFVLITVRLPLSGPFINLTLIVKYREYYFLTLVILKEIHWTLINFVPCTRNRQSTSLEYLGMCLSYNMKKSRGHCCKFIIELRLSIGFSYFRNLRNALHVSIINIIIISLSLSLLYYII